MTSQILEKLFLAIGELEGKDIEFQSELFDEPYEIHLFSREEFEDGQLGYRVDDAGNSLIYPEGDWQCNWYVIGFEELLEIL
jgi:hypothetical protein